MDKQKDFCTTKCRSLFYFHAAARADGAGLVFSFGQAACAPRGAERFYVKRNCSLLMSKENQKTTSDFDALDPRERGYSPLSDPEGEVETEKS